MFSPFFIFLLSLEIASCDKIGLKCFERTVYVELINDSKIFSLLFFKKKPNKNTSTKKVSRAAIEIIVVAKSRALAKPVYQMGMERCSNSDTCNKDQDPVHYPYRFRL